MTAYQMRLINAALLRGFKVSSAPETAPESMTFKDNDTQSRYEKFFLMLHMCLRVVRS